MKHVSGKYESSEIRIVDVFHWPTQRHMDPFTAMKELGDAKKIYPRDEYVLWALGPDRKRIPVSVSFPFRLEQSDEFQPQELHVHVRPGESKTTLKATHRREESSPFFVRVPESELTPEDIIKVTLPNGDVMRFLPVQPGRFYFGASEKEVIEAFGILQVRVDYETPQTIRTIQRKYWVAEYELTRGQFVEHLKNDKSFQQLKDGCSFEYWKPFMEEWQYKERDSTELCLPVTNLLVSDVQSFTKWLNAAKWEGTGKPSGYKFDLPAEIEWEYAAKDNGLEERRLFPWGNSEEVTSQKAVFSVKKGSTLKALKEPLPVGNKPEGKSWTQAQDMAGNVHELCRNYFFDYNDIEAVEASRWKINPAGKDKVRVCRGGAYNTSLWESRCSSRFQIFEDVRLSNVGARIFFVESKD